MPLISLSHFGIFLSICTLIFNLTKFIVKWVPTQLFQMVSATFVFNLKKRNQLIELECVNVTQREGDVWAMQNLSHLITSSMGHFQTVFFNSQNI